MARRSPILNPDPEFEAYLDGMPEINASTKEGKLNQLHAQLEYMRKYVGLRNPGYRRPYFEEDES